MNDIVNFLNQLEEQTDLEIALKSADSGSAGHWPTVASVLALEYRKVHSALAIAGNGCQRVPSDVEIADGYSMLASEILNLKEWASKKRGECVLKHATPGAKVLYGGTEYEVARVERGMIGIYDEPPSRHVDFINPRNLTLAYESQREAAGTDDGKPDGQAENTLLDHP